MITETMTVAEALETLKTIEKKLGNSIDVFIPCRANKVKESNCDGIPKDRWKEENLAVFHSVVSLLNRRRALKEALNTSNAQTKIKVCGREMSIAAAIDMKQYGISFYEDFLSRIANINAAEARRVNDINLRVDMEAQKSAEAIHCSNSDNKPNPEDFKKTVDDYVASHRYELFSAINVEKEIHNLQDFIDNFTTEINSKITISNATTNITFSYENKTYDNKTE